ncbi:MAG: hypothetical protein ACTSX8_10485 [Alphaproteobacteria bacterium]
MAHTKIITARFWVSHGDDYVRLSLRDGESVDMFEGGPTDEGSSAKWTTYTRDGDTIACDSQQSSRDCDGAHSSAWECETTIRDLTAAEPISWNPERPPMPQWSALDSSQRDYSAEAAGY